MAGVIHLQNWLKWSEPDYYGMFVKSWVPFNAWFMDSFYDDTINRTRDRQILDHIKTSSNKVRDRIVNLLNRSVADSDLFYLHLDGIDRELEAHTLYNRGERVSFSTTRLSSNPISSKILEFGHYKYKCEKVSGAVAPWRCQILKKTDGATVCQFSLPKWDLDLFRMNPDFLSIRTSIQKQKLEECFKEIDPRPMAKVVLQMKMRGGAERAPEHSLCVSAARKRYFTDDSLLVAQVLIEILYTLRCVMFHGTLDPTKSNQGIYQHAFYLMGLINQELV